MEPILTTWVYLELSEYKLLPAQSVPERPWGFGHQLITKSPIGSIHQNEMVLLQMNNFTEKKKKKRTDTFRESDWLLLWRDVAITKKN